MGVDLQAARAEMVETIGCAWRELYTHPITRSSDSGSRSSKERHASANRRSCFFMYIAIPIPDITASRTLQATSISCDLKVHCCRNIRTRVIRHDPQYIMPLIRRVVCINLCLTEHNWNRTYKFVSWNPIQKHEIQMSLQVHQETNQNPFVDRNVQAIAGRHGSYHLPKNA